MTLARTATPGLRPRSTPAAAGTPDPLMAERKRREYESLFASNVVMSRRPDGQRLADGARRPRHRHRAAIRPATALPTPPNIDDVADAVVRATTSVRASRARVRDDRTGGRGSGRCQSPRRGIVHAAGAKVTPASTGPITSDGPAASPLGRHADRHGLTNRLDGSVGRAGQLSRHQRRSTRTTDSTS